MIISNSGPVITSVSYYIGLGIASFVIQIAVMVLVGGLTFLVIWKQNFIHSIGSLFRRSRKNEHTKRNKRS